MDGTQRSPECYSLKEADAALWKARRRMFFDPARWEIAISSLLIACMVLGCTLALFGHGAEPFLAIILIVVFCLQIALVIGNALSALATLRRARGDFFDAIAYATAQQSAIVERLVQNGEAWLNEQRLRVLHAMESQVQRNLLWSGKLTQTGVVPLAASLYLAYRTHQIPQDIGLSTPEMLVVGFSLGLYLGYVFVVMHHMRLRKLLLTMELALQRLGACEKQASICQPFDI